MYCVQLTQIWFVMLVQVSQKIYCMRLWITKRIHALISMNFHLRHTSLCWPDIPLYVDTVCRRWQIGGKTLIQCACLIEFKACSRSESVIYRYKYLTKSFFGFRFQLCWFLNGMVYSIVMKHGRMKPKYSIWQYLHLNKYWMELKRLLRLHHEF